MAVPDPETTPYVFEALERLAEAARAGRLDDPSGDGHRRVGDLFRVAFGAGPGCLAELPVDPPGTGELVDQLAHWTRELVHLDERPPPPEPREPLGRALWGISAPSGRPGTAERLAEGLTACRALGDRVAEAYGTWYLAEHHAHTGDYDAAGAAVDDALALGAELPELHLLARYTRAVACLGQGLPETALDVLEGEARTEQGRVPAGLVDVGRLNACEALGRIADAAEAAERAMKVFEAARHARLAALSRLELARMWVDLGRAEDAIRLLRRDTTTAGTRLRPYADLTLGLAYVALGQPRAARTPLRAAATRLPAAGDHVLLALAEELRAATWTGTVDAELGARVAAAEALIGDRESATALSLAMAGWHPGADDSPELLLARARAGGNATQLCEATRLRVEQAFAEGQPALARQVLDDTRMALAAAEQPPLQAALALLSARWELRYGQLDDAIPDRLLRSFEGFGDERGQALALLLRAQHRATSAPELARGDAIRAQGIARVRGFGHLADQAAILAAVLGHPAPSRAAQGPEEHLLAVAAGLKGWREGLGEVEHALERVPPANRAHLRRLLAPPLARAGLYLAKVGTGPGLVLCEDTRELWRSGRCLVGFGRSQLQFRLLRQIALSDETVDREELCVTVWETPYRPPSSDNRLHVHVSRLRTRLRDTGVRVEATPRGTFQVDHGVRIWLARREM